jgi:predicted outer membrane repeat protein
VLLLLTDGRQSPQFGGDAAAIAQAAAVRAARVEIFGVGFADADPATIANISNSPASHYAYTAANVATITITSAGAEASVIEGFTLRNGHAASGGGALIIDATAYFSNCVWTANSATIDGGAVRIEGGSSTFLDCTFAGNTATNGGAISIAAGTLAGTTTIEACTISDNTASELGGALHVTGA